MRRGAGESAFLAPTPDFVGVDVVEIGATVHADLVRNRQNSLGAGKIDYKCSCGQSVRLLTRARRAYSLIDDPIPSTFAEKSFHIVAVDCDRPPQYTIPAAFSRSERKRVRGLARNTPRNAGVIRVLVLLAAPAVNIGRATHANSRCRSSPLTSCSSRWSCDAPAHDGQMACRLALFQPAGVSNPSSVHAHWAVGGIYHYQTRRLVTPSLPC